MMVVGSKLCHGRRHGNAGRSEAGLPRKHRGYGGRRRELQDLIERTPADVSADKLTALGVPPNAVSRILTIAEVQIVEPGTVTLGDGVAVADLVDALVRSGVRVGAVEPQRRNLEEIYLSITNNGDGPR